jgi:hypothetical protein
MRRKKEESRKAHRLRYERKKKFRRARKDIRCVRIRLGQLGIRLDWIRKKLEAIEHGYIDSIDAKVDTFYYEDERMVGVGTWST